MKHRIICLFFVMFFCVYNDAAEKIPAIAEMFTLGNRIMVNDQHIQFSVLNTFRLSDGRTLTHYQQQYKNIPIWGRGVTVSIAPGHAVPTVTGEVVSDIASDLNHIFPKISRKEALNIGARAVLGEHQRNAMLPSHRAVGESLKISTKQQSQLWVYIDDDHRAHLAYLMSWVIDGVTLSQPTIFVDAVSGRVLKRWNGLAEGDCSYSDSTSGCDGVNSAL